MRYYVLGPEVAGGLGPNTELDRTCHPPRVKKLHYIFDGWLGDCLIESFPCFMVTDLALADLTNEGMTGVEGFDAEVSTSQEFDSLYPNRDIGRWRWLRSVGAPGKDDFAVTNSARMVASERAVTILRRHGLEHCDLEEYQGEQVGASDGENAAN